MAEQVLNLDLFEELYADDNGTDRAEFVHDAQLILRILVKKPEPIVQAPGDQHLDVDGIATTTRTTNRHKNRPAYLSRFSFQFTISRLR
ncbi:hypothetical protein PoB_005018300 [Plakobranchus ocellatus]|uniref:Uncharacterized protein n=1 Tax=Plakobranchus ocellatus TaxID=259542 RepID=A0AAV4BVQ1_9GAST|nr:hypothetical protein PoB_005018300 [Plakobranchus ocellatus]